MWEVLLAPFRARGQIREQAAQLGELTARVRTAERALTAVQSVIGELSALQQSQQEHLVAWQRSAEQHLVGLQAGHEALARQQTAFEARREELGRQQAALEAAHKAFVREAESFLRPDALRPIVDWIQLAESHLSALQSESEQLRSLSERHETLLTRAALLLASLETRADELEHADTGIAAAIAREPTFPPSK